MPVLMQSPMEATFDNTGLQQFVWDDTYYFPDGDITLRAGNTLFKVHLLVLAQESVTFGRWNNASPEPVVLTENLDDGRTLISYLYAKYPDEIFQGVDCYDQELDIIRLGCLAHLWEFPNISIKASMTVSHFRSASSERLNSPVNLPILTRFALDTGNSDLLALQSTIWKNLLDQGRDCGLAIQVAEQLGMHDLLGSAYYALMLRGPAAWFSDSYITSMQRKRVMKGWRQITELDLSNTTPILEHHPTCVQRQECQAAWAQLWKDTIQTIEECYPNVVDLREKLFMAQRELPDLELLVESLHPEECEVVLNDIGMHPLCLENTWAAGVDRYEEMVGGTKFLEYFYC